MNERPPQSSLLALRLRQPALLLPATIVGLIGLGTPLLKLPMATPTAQPIGWGDALFTMTSAVCVTGLTVRDTAGGFTPFGQCIIGLFMQLGGLTVMIFGTIAAIVIGRAVWPRASRDPDRASSGQPPLRWRRYAGLIVAATLLIEAVGGALMYPLWQGTGEPLSAADRLGMSAFHAISAFCHAGFDLTGRSLVPYRYSMLAHSVVLPLIVLGSIGFPVLANIYQVARDHMGRRRRGRRRGASAETTPLPRTLTLHTKLVLTTTAGLYLFGVVTIGAGQLMPFFYRVLDRGQTANVERPGPLNAGALGRIAADSSFRSLTARSAGFHTIPAEQVHSSGRFATMILMLVGGSPGSAAGGLKTTVLALLVLATVAALHPGKKIAAFGRSIPGAMLRQAGALAGGFVALVALATWLLTLSESFPFEQILFEVVAAAGTVGLSRGITGDLSGFGQWVLVATMLLGRVGPLTLVSLTLLSQPAPSTEDESSDNLQEEVALG